MQLSATLINILLGVIILVSASVEAAATKKEKAVNLLPTSPPVERYCDRFPMMKMNKGKQATCQECCELDKGAPGDWVLSSVISTYCYCKPKRV